MMTRQETQQQLNKLEAALVEQEAQLQTQLDECKRQREEVLRRAQEIEDAGYNWDGEEVAR